MEFKSNISASDSDFDSSQLRVMRGVGHLSNGEYEAAINEFNAAIGLYKENVDAYSFRASTYCNLGKWEDAIADYSEAINLKPEVHSYMRRGIAYFMAENFVKAREDLETAKDLKPEDADDKDALNELESQLENLGY